MARTGLFENLKSKFGATAYEHWISWFYRQLAISLDGGPDLHLAKLPAYASGCDLQERSDQRRIRELMALTDVGAGTKIEDTGSSTSQWIRLADESGNGFAESYPLSPSYDHTSMKYNAKGERVAYLKGDVVKVPAHWASPGSFFYLEAQNDVPRGIDLESLFAGNHVGPTGYFDYVGSDRSNGATMDDKPITEFLRTNANLPQPSLFTSGDASGLRDMMKFHAANGYNPGHIMVGNSIYAPAGDWGIDLWNASASFKDGDLVLDETNLIGGAPAIKEFNSLVKGNYHGGGYDAGSHVFYDGTWHRASDVASATDIPRNPANILSISTGPHSAGDAVRATAAGQVDIVMVANNNMRGTWDPNKAYSASGGVNPVVYGGVVAGQGQYVELTNEHKGSFVAGAQYTAGQTMYYNNKIYIAQQTFTADATNISLSGGAGTFFVSLGVPPAASALISADAAANGGTNHDRSVVVRNDANNGTSGTHGRSIWQSVDGAGKVGDPQQTDAFVNRTNDYTSVGNSSKWVKTHYSHLGGKTIGTSYTRGDNIHYQGKNYVYTSHLDSNDALYTDPSNEGLPSLRLASSWSHIGTADVRRHEGRRWFGFT